MTTDTNAVLACPMDPDTNDASARTVRDYLVTLLATLWREADAFSGKYPLGNSDWQFQVYTSMIKDGLVGGVIDDMGYVEDVDVALADQMLGEAIESLRQ